MKHSYEGNAIVYCRKAFRNTNGKTAHGLVRRSNRYRILSIIDEECAGMDAGVILDGSPAGIPVHSKLEQSLDEFESAENPPTHFIIGLAPDGGRLPGAARNDIMRSIESGLDIVSGLHDFLCEDAEIASLAQKHGSRLIDVRKPPKRKDLHFYSGVIDEVACLKVAVLGTDSAVGKRTTAWMIVDELNSRGIKAELVGTGQTAWLQGAQHGIILDSIVNDFVAGEIEHAVYGAWITGRPRVIVIEGQGSLMNPAYPGGFEILAAARPDCVVLQHVPGRRDYDGFNGCPIHPVEKQIQAIEIVSSKPVVAVTVNTEGIQRDDVQKTCEGIADRTRLPVTAPIECGIEKAVEAVLEFKTSSSDRV